MTECPICMEPFNTDTTVNKVVTECGHSFHCSCLMKNVAVNGFGCPYCRDVMAVKENVGDDDDDDESISSNDEVLTSFRWFHRHLDETLQPVIRDDTIVYELEVDDNGYYYEHEFAYWDNYDKYIQPHYLFYKLANDGQYEHDDALNYSDLAMAYLILKRRCNGVQECQLLPHRVIPLYDECPAYKRAEERVNKMMEKAITDYYN